MPLQEWQTYPLADSPEAAISTGGAMPWQSYQLAPEQAAASATAAAPAAASPSAGQIASDVGTQTAVGPIVGLENLATATPRLIGAAASKIAPYIESAIEKVAPGKAAEMREGDEAQRQLAASIHPPSVADYLPQPKTTEGQFARTAGEFVPAMMAAPGNLARNAVMGIVAGLSSEGAGQATKGTAAEPYARVGGGLVGGLASAGTLAPKMAALTPEAVIAQGTAAYKSPAVTGVLFAPGTVEKISDDTINALKSAKFNSKLAPQTHAIVEDLANPVSGPLTLHSMEDYQTARTMLGKVAGNFNNPIEQAAASKAIESLDKHFNAVPQSQLVSGDISAANNTLTSGRADYAAGKAAERVQQKVDNAELQAASAHSGGNIDNATRQKLRTVLTNPKQSRGLTPEEFDQIDQVVRGSTPGNVLRATGKVLGGGGGLGSLVSAAEGMHVAGPFGAAMPLAGYGVKRIGDALTTRAAQRAVQQILNRAPSASVLRVAPPNASPQRAALISALMSNSLQPQTAPLPLAIGQQGPRQQPSQ